MSDYLPGVDVVVVNYRTADDLREFLRSFADVQWEVPATLHIVNVSPLEADNEVAEEAVAHIDIAVSYTTYAENVGYARACNGVAHAVGAAELARKTIAFFNADTRLAPRVLDDCHWVLHQHDDWAIVGPKQVDDDNLITHGGIFGTRSSPSFAGRWKQPDTGQYNELRDDCVSVSGAAYFVKRAAWDALTDCVTYREIAPEAAGAFLPTQHYYEETWCSYHALEHGWKIAYNGQVSMVHRWHKATRVGSETERVLLPKSRKYFRRACDHHGIPHD